MVPSPKKAYGDEQEFYIFLVFHNRCHMVFTIRPFDSVENLFQMAFILTKWNKVPCFYIEMFRIHLKENRKILILTATVIFQIMVLNFVH